MDAKLTARLQVVLKQLRSEPASWPFLEPVDWKSLGLNEYPKIIEEPMDLKTVAKNLKNKMYKTATQFWRDVELIWSNCKKFNYESAEVYQLAIKMMGISGTLKAAFFAESAETQEIEASPAPEAIVQLAERFGRLDASDAAVVVRYIAQEAPSCLSPLLGKPEGGREFDIDIGSLFSEFPVIFKRTHGLTKILLH